MKVFVTGASGWIGSGVVKLLLDEGHEVLGLVRSEKSAEKVKNLGATPVRGTLEDLDVIKETCISADAVIHTAFLHDSFEDYQKMCDTDLNVTNAMLDALSGTGKTLVCSNGLAGTGDEDTMSATTGMASVRGQIETVLIERGEAENIRVASVRLPPSVHGVGEHGFLIWLTSFAKDSGVSVYIEDGENVWGTVHRDDAAKLYVLALTKGAPGQRLHAVAETVKFRQIAEVIGEKVGVPTKSIPIDEATSYLKILAPFASRDMTADSKLTRERLEWTPTSVELLEDYANPDYIAE